MKLRRLQAEDLPTLRAWFSDVELARRLSYPTDEWFEYVQSEPRTSVYVAEDENGDVLGHIQIDRDGIDNGHFAFFVDPVKRNHGLGKQLMRHLMETQGPTFSRLLGAVEPDNAASAAVLEKLGFALTGGPDEDGMLSFVWSPQKGPKA